MLDTVDHAVLTAIEQQVLTPEIVTAAAKRAIELICERAAKSIPADPPNCAVS